MKVLERAKILDYFKVIVCKEDVVKRKPDPAPYLKTLEKL
ncbi:HAD hydrolase-like protein [Patescibacteria group bacterium]|nr:HAD hydrolase-like protein [Patescibacteria group bacterium]